MKLYRMSNFGCLIFILIMLFFLNFILRLAGVVIIGIFSNPIVFLLILFVIYLGRHALFKKEIPRKSNEIEYEFIDEEENDPED